MLIPQDILILGDSFAFDRSQPNDWPLVLTELLTGVKTQPRGAGFKGGSWWSVRCRLLAELEQASPKIAIFCHTDPYRLASDYNYGITLGILDSDDLFVPDEVKHTYYPEKFDAAKLFYKHLFSKEYMEWAADRWYKECDELMQQHNVDKVIHLWCFAYRYKFRKGMTSRQNLFHLSSIHDKDSKQFSRNHFHERENLRLANTLLNLLSNYADGEIIQELLP
jgi:hypothetical protein